LLGVRCDSLLTATYATRAAAALATVAAAIATTVAAAVTAA